MFRVPQVFVGLSHKMKMIPQNSSVFIWSDPCEEVDVYQQNASQKKHLLIDTLAVKLKNHLINESTSASLLKSIICVLPVNTYIHISVQVCHCRSTTLLLWGLFKLVNCKQSKLQVCIIDPNQTIQISHCFFLSFCLLTIFFLVTGLNCTKFTKQIQARALTEFASCSNPAHMLHSHFLCI